MTLRDCGAQKIHAVAFTRLLRADGPRKLICLHIYMKKKTWALLCLLGIVGAYVLISAVVIYIDPFQVYHLATRHMPPIDNTTQVYANAGIVRNYDYDSAIVGTSVTENFRPSQMDRLLGGRFIKLCTSAGTAYNHALLLDIAFDTHDIRRIVYGMDVYSFIADLDQTGSEVPLYLYDRNPFNDAQYWLNRSVLGSFLPRCLRAWGQTQDDAIRDSMYCWAGRDYYGLAALYNAQFSPVEPMRPADADIQKVLFPVKLNHGHAVAAHGNLFLASKEAGEAFLHAKNHFRKHAG